MTDAVGKAFENLYHGKNIMSQMFDILLACCLWLLQYGRWNLSVRITERTLDWRLYQASRFAPKSRQC